MAPSRARSPRLSKYDSHTHRQRSRSRSPNHREHRHHHHHHHHRHHQSTHKPTPTPLPLPYAAAPLTKQSLRTYRPLFARYLDIQKQRNIDELDEREVKGRWKRFAERWNRGELAKGWYDPESRERADEAWAESLACDTGEAQRVGEDRVEEGQAGSGGEQDDGDAEDDFGPRPALRTDGRTIGARPATLDDLALRDEDAATTAKLARKNAKTAEKALTDQRLSELLPKAEPGTKERQLEKRRENAATLAAFRASKPSAGDLAEMGDAELGFGDEGGVSRLRAEGERKRSEREVRREEVRAARKAEWEERMREVREREERSLEGLRRLARERFG